MRQDHVFGDAAIPYEAKYRWLTGSSRIKSLLLCGCWGSW